MGKYGVWYAGGQNNKILISQNAVLVVTTRACNNHTVGILSYACSN